MSPSGASSETTTSHAAAHCITLALSGEEYANLRRIAAGRSTQDVIEEALLLERLMRQQRGRMTYIDENGAKHRLVLRRTSGRRARAVRCLQRRFGPAVPISWPPQRVRPTEHCVDLVFSGEAYAELLRIAAGRPVDAVIREALLLEREARERPWRITFRDDGGMKRRLILR